MKKNDVEELQQTKTTKEEEDSNTKKERKTGDW